MRHKYHHLYLTVLEVEMTLYIVQSALIYRYIHRIQQHNIFNKCYIFHFSSVHKLFTLRYIFIPQLMDKLLTKITHQYNQL